MNIIIILLSPFILYFVNLETILLLSTTEKNNNI
jgi:hypothetical protein